MTRPGIYRAIWGGFVATLIMTMMMYAAPIMGMPRMDIAAMLGSMLGGSWWMGLMMHFLNGSIIFPLLYLYVFYPAVCSRPRVKGMLWGVTLWFLAQVLVMPMMGMGFFSAQTPAPGTNVIGSLFGHLIYGVILGAIARAAAHETACCVPEIQTLDLSIPDPPEGEAAMVERRPDWAKFNADLIRRRRLTDAHRTTRTPTARICG